MTMRSTQPAESQNFVFTPDDLARFHAQGYAGPFTLYEPEAMNATWKRLRLELFDRSHAIYQLDALSGVTNISNYDRHLDVDFLAEHVCRAAIVDRVSSVLGPDVLCWRSEFFPKYPGDEGTDWHQADTFANASGAPQIVWPEDREFGGTITVWTAFTESRIDNGCLQLIPGTHRTMFYDERKRMHYDPEKIGGAEKAGVKRGFFGYDYRQLQIDSNWSPDESKAVSLVMKPGQFVMFWSTLMHASHPHTGQSQDLRLGFAARYVPSSVRVYPDTDFVEEYGGQISLEKFGCVQVKGEPSKHNRMATQTTRGTPFVRK